MHKNKKIFYAKLPLDTPISALSSGKYIQNYFCFLCILPIDKQSDKSKHKGDRNLSPCIVAVIQPSEEISFLLIICCHYYKPL